MDIINISTSHSTVSKTKAVQTLSDILKQEPHTISTLVPFDKYRVNTNLRCKKYDAFHVLYYVNTHKSSGCLVCNYFMSGGRQPNDGVIKFCSSFRRTNQFERHTETHSPSNTKQVTHQTKHARPMSSISKTLIAKGAAKAVCHDLLPFSFWYKHESMKAFSRILVHGANTDSWRCREHQRSSSFHTHVKSILRLLTLQ